MSFMVYRANKLRKTNIQDGDYISEIIKIEQDKSNRNVWYVTFKLLNGEIIRNRYVDDPNKYSAFDVLIDAVLGTDSSDVDLVDLIGNYVKISVVNESRYTNVKRVRGLNEQDKEEVERYEDEELTDDGDEIDELDDETPDDEELDLELDDNNDLEDDPEPDIEEPRRNRLGSGFGRKRRI